MNIKNCIAALSIAAVVSITGTATTAPVWGATDNTAVCAGDKVDVTGSQASITYTAPEGYLISGYCVKAGSDNQEDGGPEYTTLNPPVASVTLSHSTGKDISHYSVTLVAAITPTPTETETGTPSQTPAETPSTEVSPATAGTGGTGNAANNTDDDSVGSDIEVMGEQASAGTEVMGEQASAGTEVKGQSSVTKSAGTEVLGQQAQAAPVPTVVSAGAASEAGSDLVLPTSLALLGVLFGLVALAARRRA